MEVAGSLPGVVGVRDSKDQHRPVLVFAPGEWATFTNGVRGGALVLS